MYIGCTRWYGFEIVNVNICKRIKINEQYCRETRCTQTHRSYNVEAMKLFLTSLQPGARKCGCAAAQATDSFPLSTQI